MDPRHPLLRRFDPRYRREQEEKESKRKSREMPLYRFLCALPPRARSTLKGVRVHPKLGIQGDFRFPHAEQLLRWLESGPAHSRMRYPQPPRLSEKDLRSAGWVWPEGVQREIERAVAQSAQRR